MKVQLLGPVIAFNAEARVPVQGQRQLKFLASLALGAGQMVTKESIVEDSWDTDPPKTVSGQLQNSAWMIRTAFEGVGVGREILASHALGYQLHVPASRVDVCVFRDMVRESKEQGQAGRYREASDRLDEALALWKGQALANVTSARLRARADGLDRERLAALEQRARLDVKLGRNEEAIARLNGLIAGDPLREDLYVALMHAYYGADRQADALHVFHQAKRTLMDEIGIMPGRRLRETMQSILAQQLQIAA
ncbi:BTAD domain-containing putative transcriptional regulator [Streptomyces vinaceus]|uniref:AfsR/SARP family transcriptional regulator n=1 Tax=Streptomyces vinaceus TaxID=1960 RepID=UPI003822C5D5